MCSISVSEGTTDIFEGYWGERSHVSGTCIDEPRPSGLVPRNQPYANDVLDGRCTVSQLSLDIVCQNLRYAIAMGDKFTMHLQVLCASAIRHNTPMIPATALRKAISSPIISVW